MAVRTSAVQNTKATHVFLVLWKTYRAMFAKSDECRKNLGLCDSDFRVLEVLLHKGPLPVNVIGGRLN
jgi:MarR family transcriptional regulator, 2-MHQ and catechol-resistance regulon repressor